MTILIEILSIILHYLKDDRSALHACLFLSHAWSKVAVEHLYKAEHMMNNYESHTLGVSVPSASMDGPSLMGGLRSLVQSQPKEPSELNGPSIGSVLVEGNGSSARTPASSELTVLRQGSPLLSTAISQSLLWQTLEDSVVRDEALAYNYISHLNKISCPWFNDLVQDWDAFCKQWKSSRSRYSQGQSQAACPTPGAVPSTDRRTHCFNRFIRNVSRRCRFVEEFRASRIIYCSTLVYSLRHFKRLTWLDLEDALDLSTEVFQILSTTTRTLSYIRLSGTAMKNADTQSIVFLIRAQKENVLTQFKITGASHIFNSHDILKAIGECHGESMKRMTFAICDLDGSGLDLYGPLCKNLASLNLEYSSGITNEVIIPILNACRRLEKLDLTDTECSLDTILAFSASLDSSSASPQPGQFTMLKQLILNNMDSPFTAQAFIPLADACPELEELHMNSLLADSFQDFIPFISKFKALKELDVGNVFPEFNDANLISLVDAQPGLRWISIANAQITDVSLAHLAEHALELCDLCILGCDQVTKAGVVDFLDKIVNKGRLKRLDITYCGLDRVSVSEIRERVKRMVTEHGLLETPEVDGDDQFAEALRAGDDEDGAHEGDMDHTDDENEDEEEYQGQVSFWNYPSAYPADSKSEFDYLSDFTDSEVEYSDDEEDILESYEIQLAEHLALARLEQR
ncbi:hypothetical protein BGW38_005361 [Lunasporangiospora selenospora]|uniref:RNI-like protein n=1 Tax=Lunasporangiospora selenospora TaxID=979761 RepID=A0A9P6G0C6_9FUNG|nr:hypothetical protein BGW38_005361 [Lunasporangiospora selenospora]